MYIYNINVEEIKSTEFQLKANNKEEVKKMVEEIIYKTSILDLPYVHHNKKFNIVINKIKKVKNNG